MPISTRTSVDKKFFKQWKRRKNRCVIQGCVLPPHSGDCIFKSTHPFGFHVPWKKSNPWCLLSNSQWWILKNLKII